ncbi:hypothetical protein RF240_22270, partial [Dickeya dadantii]|uniref:hypothetical protein n=1 Tax=Dickeya dadantii TaxID=204038 RepID=UPI0035A8F535
RSKILTGAGRAKIALTEAIKSLLNVSGREADLPKSLIPAHSRFTSKAIGIHAVSSSTQLTCIASKFCRTAK